MDDLPCSAPLEMRLSAKILSFGATIKRAVMEMFSVKESAVMLFPVEFFISKFFIQLKVFVGIW